MLSERVIAVPLTAVTVVLGAMPAPSTDCPTAIPVPDATVSAVDADDAVPVVLTEAVGGDCERAEYGC